MYKDYIRVGDISSSNLGYSIALKATVQSRDCKQILGGLYTGEYFDKLSSSFSACRVGPFCYIASAAIKTS